MLRPGDRVDRYTLVKPLGEGGQGSVWKAIDPLDGGRVRALKLIHLQSGSAAASERARREANVLAKAKHPALVDCYSLFEEPKSGLVGLVFEFVQGRTLAEAACAPEMTPRHCRAALEHIADALAYIHSIGLVHRDLKLENILVTDPFWVAPQEPGTVKLVDFGIAVPLGNPRPLTATGGVIGTLPYLPPDLVDPATWGRLPETFARDMFAFGVLAWELLRGAHPTGLRPDASAVDYARAYKAAASGVLPWPPRGLDGPLGAAVSACLELRPEARPASGAALAHMVRSRPSPAEAAAIAAPTAVHRGPAPLQSRPLPAPVIRRTPAASLAGTAPFKPPPPSPPASTAPMPTSVSRPPPIAPRSAPTLVPVAPSSGAGAASGNPPASRPPKAKPSLPRQILRGLLALIAVALVVVALEGLVINSLLSDSASSPPRPASSGVPGPNTAAPSGASPLVTAQASTSAAPQRPSASSPSPAPDVASAACSAPCCGGVLCKHRTGSCQGDEKKCEICASGRKCVSGSCDDYIHPNSKWLLRLASALEKKPPAANAVNMLKAHKNAEVCVSLAGQGKWRCTRLEDAAKRQVSPTAVAAMKSRLPVRTSDLSGGGKGIDIQVKDGGRILANEAGAAFSDHLQNTALCIGIRFRIKGSPGTEIFFYLDDP